MKINTISPDSSDYLQGLNEIAKPPKTLRYIGTVPAVRIKNRRGRRDATSERIWQRGDLPA